jgi:serine/threonine-protein kinase
MPIFKGRTLADRLRADGPMPFRDAAILVAELAEAVQLAHEQGIVLGDLNPNDVHLGDDGQSRLLGFEDLPLRSTDFVPGRSFGIPAYMAPEQVRGETGIHAQPGQVYALGAMLYEVLTGQPPFTGRVVQILSKVLKEKPKPPRKVVGSIPTALQSICLKALAKNTRDRYTNAGELAKALRKFLTPARRKGFWKST